MYLFKKDKEKKQVTEPEVVRHVEDVFSRPEREEKKKKIWETLRKEMRKDLA